MSKEYLEAFKIVYNNFDYLISDVVIENDDVNICLKTIKEQLSTIKQALHRLESIDNSNPSEALELVDKMANYILLDEEYGFIDEKEKQAIIKDRDTIKQALLKAQEPKQYLKWEDFIFKHKPEYIDVKMGNNKYTLVVGFNVTNCELVILRNKTQQYYFLEADKQFFNDLRLERVEE